MILRENEWSGRGVLFIDNDVSLLRQIEAAFSQAGYKVYTAADGPAGLQQFHTHQPDLVILELQLPRCNDWEVFRHIRRISQAPIIILTHVGGGQNIVSALNEGADDYLVKPVELDELLARVRARLRRLALPAAFNTALVYHDGYLTIDLHKRNVLIHGQPVHLTKTEYELLAYLFLHADQVLPHYQILEGVWGGGDYHPVDIIHLNIRRLRQKLEESARQPRYLLTEHRIGYRFKKQIPELSQPPETSF